jgi:hypothetical protein
MISFANQGKAQVETVSPPPEPRDRGHPCFQLQTHTSCGKRSQKITNIVDPFVLFNNSYTMYLTTPIHPYIVTL